MLLIEDFVAEDCEDCGCVGCWGEDLADWNVVLCCVADVGCKRW